MQRSQQFLLQRFQQFDTLLHISAISNICYFMSPCYCGNIYSRDNSINFGWILLSMSQISYLLYTHILKLPTPYKIKISMSEHLSSQAVKRLQVPTNLRKFKTNPFPFGGWFRAASAAASQQQVRVANLYRLVLRPSFLSERWCN